MACRLCVWLFICFCLFFNGVFFYLHAFLLLPCVTTPVLSWTSPRGYRRQPKSRKRRCVKKKERAIEERTFFYHPLHVCVHHLCSFHKCWFIPCGEKLALDRAVWDPWGPLHGRSLTNYWRTSLFWAATEAYEPLKIWSQNFKAILNSTFNPIHLFCYKHPCVEPSSYCSSTKQK